MPRSWKWIACQSDKMTFSAASTSARWVGWCRTRCKGRRNAFGDQTERSRTQKNAYYLISQRRCPWSVAHAGPWREVAPGESVLVDSRIPYGFDFSAVVQHHHVTADERQTKCQHRRKNGQ